MVGSALTYWLNITTNVASVFGPDLEQNKFYPTYVNRQGILLWILS